MTASAYAQPPAAIRAVLDSQVVAWNRGDLPGFMQGYWRSDSLLFIGRRITYGYEATLANYQRGYPDKAAMGTLRFELQDIRVLDADDAFVAGRFILSYPHKPDASGWFTLTLRRFPQGWRVTTDHSSSE